MKGYIKSNPTFIRMIVRSLLATVAIMLLLSWFIPAPLQEQGSLAIVPNPVKSAWFLLWIQELVSYDKRLIYAVALFFALFLCLPWLCSYRPERAGWMLKGNRLIAVLSLSAFVLIVSLTVTALYFRGENWALVSPF